MDYTDYIKQAIIDALNNVDAEELELIYSLVMNYSK